MKKLFIFFLMLLFVPTSWAEDFSKTFFEVDENTVEFATLPYIKIYEETAENPLAISEISNPNFQKNFLPLTEVFSNNSFNKNGKAHWLKLRIRNNASSDEPYKLSLPFADNITLYIPSGLGYIGKKNGELLVYSQREVPIGKMIFMDLLIPTGNNVHTYYIRISSETAISQQFRKASVQSLKIYSDNGFTQRFEKNRIFEALFYGAIIIMMLYNFFIFISLKNKSYLYYVIYLLLLLVFMSANSGYLFELLTGNFPLFDLYIRFLSAPLMLFFFIVFGQNFLDAAHYAPKMNKVLKGMKIVLGFSALLMITGFWFFGRQLMLVSAVLTYILIIYTSVLSWKNGYTPARYFLIANLFVLVGGIIYAMERFGVVVQNPLTHYGVQGSITFEVALFSIGLADRINLIQKQLATQILEKANLEKQQEIERKKIIEEKNKELEIKVIERTAEVVAQKEEIEKKSKHITASIRYAQKIQKAILGSPKAIIKSLESTYNRTAFVFFRPRDIVSGDFYWYEDLSQKQGENAQNKKIIIAADCTGHGVPGAFMTVMGNALLNEIINDMGITQPSEILRALDEKVKAILQKQEGSYSANDGMDMAIICIDDDEKTLTFAGANNPLYYVLDATENREIVRLKGSKFPIGSGQFKKEKIFEQHEISLSEKGTFYIFSDGFQDQFGGKDNRKYMSKRFREYLLSISDLPMSAQNDLLAKEFDSWKSETKQTDDVLVIGLKI